MKQGGITLNTVVFDFNEDVHLIGNKKYHTTIDIFLEIGEGLPHITIEADAQYFTEDAPINEMPLVSIRTQLKASTRGIGYNTLAMSEMLLYALKSQFRYMAFLMRQKVGAKNIDAFKIDTPPDNVLFKMLSDKNKDIAPLTFNEAGAYEYTF